VRLLYFRLGKFRVGQVSSDKVMLSQDWSGYFMLVQVSFG
jgi:hypothetical protein